MNERIKDYLDSLLQGAPKTKRVEEMRQELLAGCLDKYADLTAEGMDPEEAYRAVIEGIGDVDELLGHIERVNTFDPKAAEEKRKKRALFTTIGISFYFLSIVMIAICTELLREEELGLISFLLCVGIGTAIIIYGRMANSVKYEKADDTIVEGIKQQMTQGKKKNKLAGLASASLWCMVVVIYFAVSFIAYDVWHISWVIFIIGAALQCGLAAYFHPETRGRSIGGAFWCVVAALYFIVSFETMMWHISWIIFPFAAAGHLAVRFYLAWREEE